MHAPPTSTWVHQTPTSRYTIEAVHAHMRVRLHIHLEGVSNKNLIEHNTSNIYLIGNNGDDGPAGSDGIGGNDEKGMNDGQCGNRLQTRHALSQSQRLFIGKNTLSSIMGSSMDSNPRPLPLIHRLTPLPSNRDVTKLRHTPE